MDEFIWDSWTQLSKQSTVKSMKCSWEEENGAERLEHPGKREEQKGASQGKNEERRCKSDQSVEILSFGQRRYACWERERSERQGMEWFKWESSKMKIAVEDFAPIAEAQEAKQQVIVKSARASHVSSELDLRGKRYEEAMKDLRVIFGCCDSCELSTRDDYSWTWNWSYPARSS